LTSSEQGYQLQLESSSERKSFFCDGRVNESSKSPQSLQ